MIQQSFSFKIREFLSSGSIFLRVPHMTLWSSKVAFCTKCRYTHFHLANDLKVTLGLGKCKALYSSSTYCVDKNMACLNVHSLPYVAFLSYVKSTIFCIAQQKGNFKLHGRRHENWSTVQEAAILRQFERLSGLLMMFKDTFELSVVVITTDQRLCKIFVGKSIVSSTSLVALISTTFIVQMHFH